MKYCYFKTRSRHGFTLVELMVVLAVTAILAALAGGGLLAYIRLARFQKNESNARAMFQTAQLAAAQMELAGEKDDFTAQVAANGHGGHITQPLTETMTQDEYNALNARVYALYFDKGAEPTPDTPEGKLYAYIKQYVYDSSFLDAAFCIEIDASTGQVFSVFYDSGVQALRFANNKGQTDATLLDDRSYQNRRDRTLVGYYCADDAVNVVNLQQSKLRVRNQRLINGETLDLTWGGTSKSNETDTQYTVDICSKTDDKKLFSVLVTLPTVTETQKTLPVTLYDEHGSEKSKADYTFPLRYANGSFVLTLDAMNDAAILQARNDAVSGADIDKTEFFSITRFVKDATDIYAKITAAPRAESVTSYTVSEGADTNTENSLYANASADLQCFRHLYNLRWYAGNSALTAKLTKDIDWLSGVPVVYCAEGTSAAAKTPAADAPVAWPSLLALKEKVTLNGDRHTITGLQLRGNSVAKDGCRYIGLVAENSGTIQNLTLADPDVLVNLTAEPTGTYTVGGETLAVMDTDAEGYRENVRAVGALCGVSTGTVQNCTVKRSKNRTATARVAASLAFDDQTTTYTRTDADGDGKIDKEPLGIGGLVGSAVPGNGKTLQTLTVDKNVTVAGIWQDGGTKTTAAANEATERTRITATDIDRAIGVGGVFGVLSLQDSCTVDTLNNSAEVCGNAYTGGVAGNLCGKSASETTANNLNNTGSVLALAGYQGYTAGESRVLGQFFGGVAGMMKYAELENSYSSTRSSLSENDVKTLIVNGYDTNGALSAASPLQGDFVGGLVGFGDSVTITDCKTGSGYVLGNTFVGGVVGGLSTGTVLSDGTENSSHVFGHRYVGGVVSFNGKNSKISGMRNTGMTAAFGTKAAYAGGIVGYNEGTLTNCTAAASTNTATNASRVQLLQAMAKDYYADFVGGVAGCNAGTIHWTHDAAVSTLLHGGSFVGGVVGFNDENAKITVQNSATLTVSGRIVGAQDAVGGLAGLNCGTTQPAVTVKAELVSGRYCVGGVLGANVVAQSMSADKLCTGGSGNSLQAQALAGGIVGYNQVIAAMPTESNTITRAKRLLPVVTDTNSILTVSEQNAEGTATVTLNGSANALNLTADAYVGGVVGYGDHLALNDAQNGAQHSVSKGVLHSSGSLLAQPAPSADAVTGNMAGGIIGYAGGSATLDNCQNYAGVFHKQAAGGIAGYNAGTIQNCTQNANLGTRQTGYTYIGGIAGVNAGTIETSAPDRVTISGEQAVGGVAGLNAQNGTIENITDCTVTVQGSQVVGGLAGKNNGTVQGSTLLTVNVAASGSNAGGAVGQNLGGAAVNNVTVTGGSVQGSKAVGGLAGENLGSVQGCTTASTLTVRANQNAGAAVGSNAQNAVVSAGNYAGTVYAASGNAGGIAGQNAGSIGNNATVSATVTCENGDAGGVAALNSGSISAVQVKDCTVNSGSAYMGAVAAVNNGTIQGVTVQSAALQGDATVIGGIAGLNNATIGTETSACKVEQNALTFEKLTAADITLGGAAGQNETGAAINNVQVALNVTEKLAKYRTLGGVAGVNNGTLQNCAFTEGQLGENIASAAPAATGAAKVGDAIGGVAGVNNATVTGCTVQKIRINVLGITNVESSQDVETKLNNASHVGGIVGRNSGTIEKSFIGTDESSAVIAKYGFVGGIAGSNAGEISGCGGKDTAAAVNKIKDWLENGETDTMIAELKYSQDVDNKSETDSLDTDFTALRGVDAVRAGDDYTTVYTEDGLAKNQLTVALRGSATKSTEQAAGYLGGVTGYNTDTGALHDTATGKWFVYCDNGNVDNAVIGGMIGQNESDKDMTNLLNCAAVRRFNRTKNNAAGNDDTQNSSKQHVANANVGGVIGVQQNRSGDRWSLTNVVNYGTVHNSRSNNLAGIICLWVDNGGTLEHCFNFGTMRANSNGGAGSGTMGGIVALFDKPVAGGTTNLVSCQNHGDMLWENETERKTANDVGGILGKIQMKDASDYLVVNITDCVNGSIKMQSNSLCVGVMAWLGPQTTIENAEVNIDRCRNYCLDMTSVGGANDVVGIYGNRGNGGVTRAATTITNCFALYRSKSPMDDAWDNSDCAIMRPFGGSGKENIHLDPKQPNLYMDKSSFDVSTATNTNGNATPYALETLKRGEVYPSGENYNTPKSGKDRSNKTYFDTKIIPGYRLYAGKNTTSGKYFAALIADMGAGGGNTLEKIDGGNSYIQDNTIVSNAETSKKLADILFTFGESDTADAHKKYDSNRPDMSDITDTAVQAYYKDVLDKQYDMENAEVTDINAVWSDATGDGAPIYGRYRVTWKAVTGASHYKVTVKVQDGETYKEMPEILPTATVYTNQYTFEAPEDWAGKHYIVEVTPCNSKEGKATPSDTVFTFAKTLPTPQIKLLSFDSGVDVILENVDDYTDVKEDWKISIDYGGSYPKTINKNDIGKGGIKGYLFWLPNSQKSGTVSVRATVKANNSTEWMQSAQYNVMTYLPGNNYGGLGTLTIANVAVTGTSTDNLAITADVKITGQKVNPKYRIMLQGKPKDKKLTSVKGHTIGDAYVTLQAVEMVLSGSATHVTFSDLPDAALTEFTDLRILAAPVNTGMGDTTCRWEFRPVGDKSHPVEYVREVAENGTVSYATYVFASLWHPENYPCTQTEKVTLKVVPAPTLGETATYTLDNNNLLYTFTWDNAAGASDYTYKLYGVTDANNEVEINLPTDAVTLISDGAKSTLTVAVDKLANGAADWHFATVRLAVTSVPAKDSTNPVGATASREYTGIRTRLTKPGAPNSVLLTNNADAETLLYKITWTGIPDSALDHYELQAEYKDGDVWKPAAETWTGTADAHLTVNLEKYQGKTLRLRVVAVPADESGAVQRSPYSETSIGFTVVTRETAPTVSKVEFTNTTPTQDEFLNRLQVQFAVNDSSSHYVTGYLFKDKTDYDAVANLVNDWNTATNDNKADKLKALQEKLETLLQDGNKAVCLIPQESRTTGLQAETTGNTVQYTLTPDKFAMQPQYGGWYLLPAVRTMTTAEDKACSVWTYYTTALQVPCIRLDTPLAVRSTSEYTGAATISDAPGAESGTDTPLTVQRVAVQWSADNLYTAADGETMLANVYEVTVTPTENNGSPYTLRITVQPKDEYKLDDNGETVKDENGDPIVTTARGAVLKVEKIVDESTSFELKPNNDGSWYLDTTQTTDEDGNPVLEPTTLTGAILQGGNLRRYYTMQVHPMLQYVAETKTYRLILPDLAEVVYADPDDSTSGQLTPYTAEVKITAKGEKGFAAVQDSEAAVINNPQQTN